MGKGGVMTKVYIVTNGEYSDYHIVNVFSDKGKAEKYVKAIYGINDEVCIEEYDVDKYPKQIDKKLKHWWVEMLKNGEVDGCMVSDSHKYSDCRYYILNNFMTEHVDYLNVFCWAKDKQHAIKIANEKRAMLVASNLWRNGYDSENIKKGVQ